MRSALTRIAVVGGQMTATASANNQVTALKAKREQGNLGLPILKDARHERAIAG